MKKLLQFLLLAGSTVLMISNCGITKDRPTSQVASFEGSPLLAYGEYLYERESCGNCHTLNINEANYALISLDGLGGKYYSNWLYDYLDDPNLLVPGSRKPPYTHLREKSLERAVLDEITRNAADDSLWTQLLEEAHEMVNELNDHRTYPDDQEEVLALIAYLQQIPSSPEKALQDSLEYAAYLQEQEAWNAVTLDSSSLIFTIATNPDNIGKGARLFARYCTPCHGEEGGGIIGPNLTDDYWLHGGSTLEIAHTIMYGIPYKGMISWKTQLRPEEIGQLVAFVTSLRGSNPANPKAPQGTKE
jgi:mono/diheme cytochrome c family protein/cbb3-type cytochrome oxidase cytochrome c subunit